MNVQNENIQERTNECKGCIADGSYCEVCKQKNFEYYVTEAIAWYPQ